MKSHFVIVGLVFYFAAGGCSASKTSHISTSPDGGKDAYGNETDAAYLDTHKDQNEQEPVQDGETGERDSAQLDVATDTKQDVSDASLHDAVVDIDFAYDSNVSDGANKEGCVNFVADMSPIPLDIYFLLDASNSMNYTGKDPPTNVGDCDVDTQNFKPANESKWCKAINAIAGYVSSAEAKGNRVALQYFEPYEQADCASGDGYSTPKIPFDALTGAYSGHAKTIVEGPGIGLNWASAYSMKTPIEGALRGIAQCTSTNRHPSREMIGILVTDGDPVGCDNNNFHLADIVAKHYQDHKIHTFIVGINGANYQNLETWAAYKGSIKHNENCGRFVDPPCAHYDVKDGDPTVFISALKKIQKAAVECKYAIPEAFNGITDFSKTHVAYDSGSGPLQQLDKKDNSATCGADPGWYFDTPATPSYIELCTKTCDLLKANTKASVKVRILCEGA